MARSRKKMAAILAAAALVLGTTTATAAPAAAATVRPMTSWLGACHPWNDNETAGGWCDGNGPNWTYQAVALCENIVQVTWITTGVVRWAGDRRGSYAYCSTRNGFLVQGWIYVYYNNVYQEAIPA